MIAHDPGFVFPELDWQSNAWRSVDAASDRLASQDGNAGRLYLEQRGISRATVLTYRLGFAKVTKSERPAIVIPWFDDSAKDGELITAIKYRFIDALAKLEKSRRFMMAGGSKPIIFGLHAAAGHDVLILVEGEVNAMSIAQVGAAEVMNIDALSFGSQSGSHQDVLRKVSQEYRRVIVWADDPEKAKEIRSALKRPADALCSPEIDGTKYDANALLQLGWLSDFLVEAIR
jgi:5S rRNA maturation endonuclease (ribonuclease M5)